MNTIIEPFKIKMVEPIKLTTPEEREAIREGEKEFASGKTRRLEDVLHELER